MNVTFLHLDMLSFYGSRNKEFPDSTVTSADINVLNSQLMLRAGGMNSDVGMHVLFRYHCFKNCMAG